MFIKFLFFIILLHFAGAILLHVDSYNLNYLTLQRKHSLCRLPLYAGLSGNGRPQWAQRSRNNAALSLSLSLFLRQRKEMLQRDEKRWLSSEQVSLSLGWLPAWAAAYQSLRFPHVASFLTHLINETLFSLGVHSHIWRSLCSHDGGFFLKKIS